jgi:hypothetical protein
MHRAVLYMPSWFPGAGFKRCARKWRPIIDNALQTPHDKVKGELVSFSGNLVARPLGFALLTACAIPPLHISGLRNGCPIGRCKYDIKT